VVVGSLQPGAGSADRRCLDAGALGAKLSGAGCGGNMIALASLASAPVIEEALCAAGARGIIVDEVRGDK